MIKRSSKVSIHHDTSNEEQNDEEHYYEWHSKFSPKDLHPFCEQLGKFVKYIHSVQELSSLTYGYPSTLQQRLEADANELQSLYLEVKAAVTDIERIKQQRKCIHKEINAAKKVLKKLREEEVREMEATVLAYDKPMYTRWENLKNTSKPQILQVFLNDIKVKQEALEHLNTLVSRKLQQITPLSMPWGGGINNTQTNKDAKEAKEEKRKLNTRNSVNNRYHHGISGIPRWTFGRSNTSQPARSVGFTPPPPLQQQQQQQQQESNPLPLVPFTMNNTHFHFMSRDANESLSAIEESNSIHLFRDISNFAVNSLNSTENNNNLNIPTNATATNETQGDMTSVLQALFGQLHHIPPIPISTTDTDTETTNDSSESIDDEGVDLFRHF